MFRSEKFPEPEVIGLKDDERLAVVYKAETEMDAITISALLEQNDIKAAVRSRQIPMYDGIAKIFDPVWGEVLVFESDLEEARQLVADYLRAWEEER
ncbi:hypothetical protein GF402_05015 [Candidatus Fermentibacteria bacterium]|nr:hypothetical protein [Candidatus Fermentibacteria bacterium]